MRANRQPGTPVNPITAKKRCAVYTRKSTDEGLDQEYNSLEAQRDAGLAYIASQRHEGWIFSMTGRSRMAAMTLRSRSYRSGRSLLPKSTRFEPPAQWLLRGS